MNSTQVYMGRHQTGRGTDLFKSIQKIDIIKGGSILRQHKFNIPCTESGAEYKKRRGKKQYYRYLKDKKLKKKC